MQESFDAASQRILSIRREFVKIIFKMTLPPEFGSNFDKY